jgi:hypothetical protein
MAAQHNIAITQLAQVGLAEKTAQELQSHPEVQSQTAGQLTPEALRKQGSTVQNPDPGGKARSVSLRDKRNRERQGGRRDKKQGSRNAAPGDENPSAPDSVWAGNILNLKV